MCNYQYINKGINNDGKNCVYPKYYLKHIEELKKELPIDENGFCLFHSKNEEWKIQNGFKEIFFELIKFKERKYKETDKLKWGHKFSGFIFPNYEVLIFQDIEFNNTIDLSSCMFNTPLRFKELDLPSIDIQHSNFNEVVVFEKCSFKNTLYGQNSTFENGVRFLKCSLPNYIMFDNCKLNNNSNSPSCEVSIKECDNLRYLSFENSKIIPRFSLDNTNTNDEIIFNNCEFYDEFYFENSIINDVVSFNKTSFILPTNKIPRQSAVSFHKITLTENAKIQFNGQFPQEDVVKSELGITFLEKPTSGLILFENFNLNKIYPDDKILLLQLEKEGVVEIGKGCRKYYVQTDIFTINVSKSTQSLILDLVKVFSNYFELQNNSNLGVEIVERSESCIKYFYFSDEEITKTQFLEKLNLVEISLWETFSNISRYSISNINDIEKKNLLIDLAGLFLKFGNYSQNQIATKNDLSKVLNSISAKEVSVLNENKELTINILQGNSIIKTEHLTEAILKKLVDFPNIVTPITLNLNTKIDTVQITQHFYGTVEKVINSDNFFENNQSVTNEQRNQIIQELTEIKNEESFEKKESKFVKFIKNWAGTISEVATPIIKELVMPK